MINIAIIVNNKIFRESLVLVINQIDDFNVAYESDNLQNVIHFLEDAKIDIILIDYNIGENKLNQANEQIVKFFPHVKTIILSDYDVVRCNEKLLNKEISNVIFKNAEKKEFEKIIWQVNSQ